MSKMAWECLRKQDGADTGVTQEDGVLEEDGVPDEDGVPEEDGAGSGRRSANLRRKMPTYDVRRHDDWRTRRVRCMMS